MFLFGNGFDSIWLFFFFWLFFFVFFLRKERNGEFWLEKSKLLAFAMFSGMWFVISSI